MFINVETFLWLQDIKSILDKHDIKDAEELERRLDQNQKPTPTVIVTIPPSVMRNLAPGTPKPTIGRIVHYIDKDEMERPAIITGMSSYSPEQKWVYLRVFVWANDKEDISDFSMHDEENRKAVRTWHWPERED